MIEELSVNMKFIIVHCANCGCPFGITCDLYNRRRNDGREFYCPSSVMHVNRFNPPPALPVQTEKEYIEVVKEIESPKLGDIKRAIMHLEPRRKTDNESKKDYQKYLRSFEQTIRKVSKAFV